MLTITISVFALPNAVAHYPPWLNIPTHCYAAVSPETIGIGQEMILVFGLIGYHQRQVAIWEIDGIST
jgi:hypothetical protein